jgi:flagellar motility protein MotE (MotC chaperone)
MANAVKVGLTALVMCALSAGASWAWRHRNAEPASQAGEAAESSPAEAPETAAAPPPKTAAPRETEPLPTPSLTAPPASRPTSADANRLRVAYGTGNENAVQLAASLRDRVANVRERENDLMARQTKLEIIYEDIRAERETIDEMRRQLSAEAKGVEEKLQALESEHTAVAAERQELENRRTEIDADEKTGVKRVAAVYEGMEPAQAARVLKDMADRGQMDTAVKVLGQMKERQAAKVLTELASMTEPALVGQLTDRLKDLKRPTTKSSSEE